MTGHLEAALAAVDRGWPVFPLRPGQKRPRAQMTGWEQRATTDRCRVEQWWRRHPSDNIAIATGPARLIVVDLDLAGPDEPRPPEMPTAESGVDAFAALAARHGGRTDDTWTVATPSGGRHLYYRIPAGRGEWRNTAGQLGWHVDTRAGGGYVVAAGSVVDGRRYRVVHSVPPVEVPRWLADELAPAPVRPAGSASVPRAVPRGGGHRYGPERSRVRSSGCSTHPSANATPR